MRSRAIIAMIGVRFNVHSGYTQGNLIELLEHIDIETTAGSKKWWDDMPLKHLSYKHSAMAAALAIGVAMGTPWPCKTRSQASSMLR